MKLTTTNTNGLFKILLVSLTLMLSYTVYSALTYKNPKKEGSSVVVTQATGFFSKQEVDVPLKPNQKKIITLDIDPSRTVVLLGEFGFNAVEIAEQIDRMNSESETEPINLIIMSPGGSVLTGGALISAIESSKAEVRVICKVLCASMAAITLQYGHKRYATDRTIIMYHSASGGAQGDVDRMHSQIGMIKTYVGKMEAHVAQRMGISFDFYKSLSGVELWIDSQDSKNNKYIDEIVTLNVLSSEGNDMLLPSEEQLNKLFKTTNEKAPNPLDIKL